MVDPSALEPPSWMLLDESASAALDALLDDNPVPLADYLAALGVDVDGLWQLPRWNAESEGEATRRRGAADDQRRTKVMRQAILAAVGRPAGAALLGFHIWNLCNEAWEHSYQFDRLIGTLQAYSYTWSLLRLNDADERSRAVGDAVAALADSLVVEIEVESALCRGDLPRHAAVTTRAVEAGRRLADLGGRIDDAFAPLREHLLELAEARIVYYRAVNEAIDAAAAAFDGHPEAVAAAVGTLREAERDPALSHIERSELRAHRFSLERIAAAAAEEWLTVDHAKLVYLFPFGLSGPAPVESVAFVRGLAEPPAIAGVEARAVRRSFELDDVWAGSDSLDRRFEGVAIELPDVTLAHPDGEVIAELAAEVRISELGNHYLRLETEIHEHDPHQVQFALFRAAPEHASIAVTCGEASWDRLADFATSVQAGSADLLSAVTPARARSGRYHVIMSVHEASAGSGPGCPAERRRPVESKEDLCGLFGAQALLHPIPNGIGSICDWAGCAVDERRLLGPLRKEGDLVATTANTTVTALFGSPSFMIGMFESVAEFVGSLDGLFSAWHDRLARHHQPEVMRLVEAQTDEDSADALNGYGEQLRREQLALHDFATETRSVLALIHSPNLMTSPIDAETLVVLLRAAELDQRELEFATKLRELLSDRIEVRIDALAEKLQRRLDAERERQDQFNRSIVEALLAAIAVFGMSGAVQVVQGAGHQSEWLAWGAVAFMVTLAAVLSWLVFRWLRGRRPNR